MEKNAKPVGKMVPDDHVLVIFGANGDLSRRKLLPALFHLFQEGLMPRRFRVIGNSRSPLSDQDFREFARSAVDEFCRCDPDDESWAEFSSTLSYVSHEFTAEDNEPVADAVRRAEKELGVDVRRLFYLSVPPPVFSVITRALGACGLDERGRVVFEKPYGLDLESFRELDAVVRSVLDDTQVFRIDHFLGKETVQNILALRFANGMFEPIWNRQHVEHVQIDVPETLGIGRRSGFYERTGAFRDMIVTHLFQVLSFVAMEPPTSLDPKPLQDESAKVFDSMVELSPDDVVYGQYDGYVDEDGVSDSSQTETFAAARLSIDNWRWAGVPFYLRTGKRMAEDKQMVTLAFREPPRQMFRELDESAFDQDHLALELAPDEGISVSFLAKNPGPEIVLAPAEMRFRYEGSFGSTLIEAYERLIHDALIGDRTLFTRGDGVERVWEVVEPVLRRPPKLHPYPQDSWGPVAADELISPHRWHLGG